MKYITAFTFSFLMLPLMLWAQTGGSEVYLYQQGTDLEAEIEKGGAGSSVTIEQIGHHSFAAIRQSEHDYLTDNHRGIIRQTGSYNIGILHLSGGSKYGSLVQIGDYNQA